MDSSGIELSVCICTHNARRHYMRRVLDGLRAQTLDPAAWELIVIDNRSGEPVAGWIDLAGIRNARVVVEEKLGLTNARIKGIRQARGALLIFVDDDNVLGADYLEHARRIMSEKPFLGAIGGRCHGEFETPAPRWSWHYFPYLAVADHGDHPLYIFHKNSYLSWYPYGAGLVTRRALAETYAEQLEQNPGRRKLDRRGNSLTSAGDIDMLLTVMDCANAIGFFPELILKHLIPRERLTLSYLRRMIYHSNYSLYQLMLSRRIQFRPRRWPLAYITGVLLCFTQGCWHPYTLWLSCFAAQGRYAAYRDYMNGLAETAAAGRTVPGTATTPPLAESAPAKTTGGKNME